MKDTLKIIFLLLTNNIANKNLEIKRYFKNKEVQKKWERFFSNKKEAIVELKNGVKLKLLRESKLTEYLLFDDFEKSELAFFGAYLQKGDFILDIGANIGLHSIYAGKIIGETGKVYAFEPVEKTFQHLQENIALNTLSNVELFKIGFSNEHKFSEMNTSQNYDAWNTLASIKNMDKQEAIKFDRSETIELELLDVWLIRNKINVEEISLVKIDVEGWEKFVALGGSYFFNTFSPVVVMEFSEENAYAAGYNCSEVYRLFTDFGYSWFAFNDSSNTLMPARNKIFNNSQNLVAIKLGSPNAEKLKNLL